MLKNPSRRVFSYAHEVVSHVVEHASQIVDGIASDQREIDRDISDAVDIVAAVTSCRIILKLLRIGVSFKVPLPLVGKVEDVSLRPLQL